MLFVLASSVPYLKIKERERERERERKREKEREREREPDNQDNQVIAVGSSKERARFSNLHNKFTTKLIFKNFR